MLYREKPLGRASIGARLAARLALAFGGRRYADLDLLSMNPHLRRDVGLHETGLRFCAGEIRRK